MPCGSFHDNGDLLMATFVVEVYTTWSIVGTCLAFYEILNMVSYMPALYVLCSKVYLWYLTCVNNRCGLVYGDNYVILCSLPSVVKKEITEDNVQLPNANGRVVCWVSLCSSVVQT